ncbi:MAG: OmpA family protein [Bacteroidota bacterium]
MKKLTCLLFFSFIFQTLLTHAQLITVEGYAYEENDRGFLNEVQIVVLDKNTKVLRAETFSNMEGFYTFEVATGSEYIVSANKKVFKENEQIISTVGADPSKKMYLKTEMARKPGYLFDVTMAERRTSDEPVDAIEGAKIEVYNNTKKEETLVLEDYPHPNFNVTFEQGNHYTVMIRKQGFFNKRMEAYVNVEGCILCFDGVGDVRPGVSDVMTKNNTMGTLLANVELERAQLNKKIQIENIYYDLAKWNIREDAAEELDKLVLTLKDNPSIIIEMGSHTDSRGKDAYNLNLSQKRAESVVNYLVANGIDSTRITAKGYGETQLVNRCKNGVKCSERRHQLNRRTELKITGFLDVDPYATLSLKDILEEEEFQRMLEEIQSEGQIKIKAGEELPDEIKKDQERSSAKKNETPKTPPTTSKVEKQPKQNIVQQVQKSEISKKETPPATSPTKQQIVEVETTTTTDTPPSNNVPSNTDFSGKVISTNDVEAMMKKENRSTLPIKIELEDRRKPEVMQLGGIASNYQGYMVQVMKSQSMLPSSHLLFAQYSDLKIEETKDGGFAYLLGEFKNKNDASNFLKAAVVNRYPKAEVVYYEMGRRVLGE